MNIYTFCITKTSSSRVSLKKPSQKEIQNIYLYLRNLSHTQLKPRNYFLLKLINNHLMKYLNLKILYVSKNSCIKYK